MHFCYIFDFTRLKSKRRLMERMAVLCGCPKIPFLLRNLSSFSSFYLIVLSRNGLWMKEYLRASSISLYFFGSYMLCISNKSYVRFFWSLRSTALIWGLGSKSTNLVNSCFDGLKLFECILTWRLWRLPSEVFMNFELCLPIIFGSPDPPLVLSRPSNRIRGEFPIFLTDARSTLVFSNEFWLRRSLIPCSLNQFLYLRMTFYTKGSSSLSNPLWVTWKPRCGNGITGQGALYSCLSRS